MGGGVGLIIIAGLLVWCFCRSGSGDDDDEGNGVVKGALTESRFASSLNSDKDWPVKGQQQQYSQTATAVTTTGTANQQYVPQGPDSYPVVPAAMQASFTSQGTGRTISPDSTPTVGGSEDPLLSWILKSQQAELNSGSSPTRTGGNSNSNGSPTKKAAGSTGTMLAVAGAAVGSAAAATATALASPLNHRRGGSSMSQRQQQMAMDVKMWSVRFRDLDVSKQIGEGSFGRVYLAKWHETLVAVKVLLSSGVSLEDADDVERAITLSNPVMENLQKESGLMAALRHPNIVGFLGVCTSPPCVITEYCARGSLTDVLRGARQSPAKAAQLDWARRLNMSLDAAKGMLYLHAHDPAILHRDLKSPNLLVDKHWKVKVSDFNLSKLMDPDEVQMSSLAATNPRWLAPEILAGGSATFASDVYAFGIVLWEMLTWQLPWAGANPWQVVTVVAEGGRLEIPGRQQLPGNDTDSFQGLDGYIGLIRRCWAQNPHERPTFQEVIGTLRDMLSAHLSKVGKMGNTNNNNTNNKSKSTGNGGAVGTVGSVINTNSKNNNDSTPSSAADAGSPLRHLIGGGGGDDDGNGYNSMDAEVGSMIGANINSLKTSGS